MQGHQEQAYQTTALVPYQTHDNSFHDPHFQHDYNDPSLPLNMTPYHDDSYDYYDPNDYSYNPEYFY